MHLNRHDDHFTGGGANAASATFDQAFRAQVAAWLRYDDARRAGSPADLVQSREVLDGARVVSRAARARLVAA